MRELQQGSREIIVKRNVEMRLNVDHNVGKASGQGAAAQSRATMVKHLTDKFATLEPVNVMRPSLILYHGAKHRIG